MGYLILIGFYFVTVGLLSSLKRQFKWLDIKLLTNLFLYHCVFAIVYYVYSLYNPSDSNAYYKDVSNATEGWFSLYGTSTVFIQFIAYPFIRFLGFNYEMMMALFSWMGYWGFVFFYIFFQENIKHRHFLYRFPVLTLILFFPNMHFWTASLGKGSTIFFGIGLVAYGISRINVRKIPLIIGLALTYHVRPHICLFLCLAILICLFTGRSKISAFQKTVIILVGIGATFLLYDKVLSFVKLDGDNVTESFESFSAEQSGRLAQAGSGIDTSNYPLILKLFTFWFRPLFFDAPGVMGLFVSLENLIYLLLTTKLFKKSFLNFLIKGSSVVQMSLVAFIASSIALSLVMSNLGIIMRQKSMVMFFLFFVIIAFMDYSKNKRILKKKQRQKRIAMATGNKILPGQS